ncbi:MAG: chemotaxis protein CheD [Ferruginibacter sp.]|nr:chemotaxis protein CheD [Cytophagales bacterium]
MIKGANTAPGESQTGSSEYATHYLLPGALFAHHQPHRVTTILGTCVAVCLWDPVLRVGGINHYLLSFWKGEGLASPKYGNIAIPKLIERLVLLGSNPRHLQAKLFGGKGYAENDQGIWMVGKRNVEIAEEMLRENQIPIVGASVGGPSGRKIVFNTYSGEVIMRPVKM